MIEQYARELSAELGYVVNRNTARCFMMLGFKVKAAAREIRKASK